MTEPKASRRRPWMTVIALAGAALVVAGCSTSSASSATAGGGTTTQATAGSGASASDNSSSAVTNACSAVTSSDVEAAFGGTYSDGSNGGDPLTCVFDLTGNEAAGVLAPGSAVQVQLKPKYYATSGMGKGVGQTVNGIGAPAEVLGNTLFIRRGADVIEILTLPYDPSTKAQAALGALAKKIYPNF